MLVIFLPRSQSETRDKISELKYKKYCILFSGLYSKSIYIIFLTTFYYIETNNLNHIFLICDRLTQTISRIRNKNSSHCSFCFVLVGTLVYQIVRLLLDIDNLILLNYMTVSLTLTARTRLLVKYLILPFQCYYPKQKLREDGNW